MTAVEVLLTEAEGGGCAVRGSENDDVGGGSDVEGIVG